MMIFRIAILTFLSINTPIKAQNYQETEISINKTFQKLENQIKHNTSLPRPFKGETINIYSYKPSQTNPLSQFNPINNKTNIMVVLPYNFNNDKDENLEYLYTKPPMVQLIPNSGLMASLSSIQEEQPTFPTLIDAKNSLIINQKSNFNSKEINSDKLNKNLVKIQNLSRNFDINHLTQSSFNPISTNSHHRQSIKRLNLTINNKEELIPNSSMNILTSDQWKYYAPPSEKLNLTDRIQSKFHSESKISTEKKSKLMKKEDLKFFKDSKNDEKSIEVFENKFETISKLPMLFVTPLPLLMDDKSKVNSNSLEKMFNISVLNDEKLVKAVKNHQIDQNNFIDDKKKHKDDGILMEKMKNDFSKHPELLKVTKSEINFQNNIKNTSENDKKNILNIDFHNLMLIQKLLMQNNSYKNNESEILISERKPRRKTQISTNKWSSFQPLRSSKVEDDDMREFLGKFGLGGGEKKSRTFKESSILDVIPEDMKKILENIGLVSMRRGGENSARKTFEHVKPEIKMNKTKSMTAKEDVKISHIQFLANPRLKRGPLSVGSIKDVVETYEDDVGNVLKKRETQVNSSSNANMANDLQSSKNEESSTVATVNIFTSEISTSTEISSTTALEIPTSISTEATSTSTFRSNLDDLENSFGGSTPEPDPELPAPRKSGLYFLVDWNTFLEVGEEDKNPVKLKFSPKIGDRTRFISVSVP